MDFTLLCSYFVLFAWISMTLGQESQIDKDKKRCNEYCDMFRRSEHGKGPYEFKCNEVYNPIPTFDSDAYGMFNCQRVCNNCGSQCSSSPIKGHYKCPAQEGYNDWSVLTWVLVVGGSVLGGIILCLCITGFIISRQRMRKQKGAYWNTNVELQETQYQQSSPSETVYYDNPNTEYSHFQNQNQGVTAYTGGDMVVDLVNPTWQN